VELTVTLTPFDKTSSRADVQFEILADDVKVHAPYLGHLITIFGCAPPASGSQSWTRKVVGQARLDSDRAEVAITGSASAYHVVRLEVDPAVVPGLYDEFRLVDLNLMSTTHSAEFGFRYI